MKQLIFSIILLLGMSACGNKLGSSAGGSLKEKIVLQMPDGNGSNGASVAFHPKFKYYYAAFAGNATFPLAVFDLKGKSIFDEAETLADMRGIWYNPKTNSLECNTFSDGGIFKMVLDKKGLPTMIDELFEGVNQPDEQSVGTYDPSTNKVYFFSVDDQVVYTYDRQNFEYESDKSLSGISADSELNNTVIFTGIPQKEWGILDLNTHTILLFDKKTGKKTGSWKLPKETPLEAFFNFSYSNNIVWIFDKTYRKWIGLGK